MCADFEDLHRAVMGDENGNGGWPRMPPREASLIDLRAYLTQAAALPMHWGVESAERHGPYGSDPLTIMVRRPGDERNLAVRFEAARECSKPAALRATFDEATRGQSRMKHPKQVEASDFYRVVCQLAHVGATADFADETQAWLDEYVSLACVLDHLSLALPDDRYDGLQALQARHEFTPQRAKRYLRGDLEIIDRWVAIVDSRTEEVWLRSGELATYLRHVFGVGSMPQHTLDARIRELGGDRRRIEENRRYQGGRHMALIFYRFPTAEAFPTLLRVRAHARPHVLRNEKTGRLENPGGGE